MKRRNEKKHVIDFLFPLAVFFVLAASSVAIVVLASGFYSRQVKASSDSYSGRTALAYVTEKMHQNDENGAIADGPDWLLIYRYDDDVLVLTLTRTGSHSDLFNL